MYIPIEEDALQACQHSVEMLENKIAMLQDKNHILKKKGDTLNAEANEMMKLIESLKNKLFGNDSEISKHKEILSKKIVTIEQLDSQIDALKQALANKDEQSKSSLTELNVLSEKYAMIQTKIDYYRDNFSDDLNAYRIYNELSHTTKDSLSGIFKDNSIKGVISCGIQERNINNLWEYIKTEVVNGSNPDIHRLISLFEILFSRFSLAFPQYKRQKTIIGEKFDTQLHIKHNSSINVSGQIESVLLQGYLNTKTDKAVKQSIIKI